MYSAFGIRLTTTKHNPWREIFLFYLNERKKLCRSFLKLHFMLSSRLSFSLYSANLYSYTLHITHAFHIVHFYIRRYSVHMRTAMCLLQFAPCALYSIWCDRIVFNSILVVCFFLYFLVVRISMAYGIFFMKWKIDQRASVSARARARAT